MWQVGAGASAASKQTTASQMDGPEGADAKDAEDADESDAKKATKDLDRLAKKDPSRFKKAVSHPLEAALQLNLPLRYEHECNRLHLFFSAFVVFPVWHCMLCTHVNAVCVNLRVLLRQAIRGLLNRCFRGKHIKRVHFPLSALLQRHHCA